MWKLPQAVIWERDHLTLQVARYVMLAIMCENPETPASIHAQMTALEDRLLLNPKALRYQGVTIGGEEPDTPPAAQPDHVIAMDEYRRMVT